MRPDKHCVRGFALYEVLIGVTIFAIGIFALGRAVENCLNATALTTDENRIREILSNRVAEIQTAPNHPDAARESKIDTAYGTVTLVQKSEPARLKNDEGLELNGIRRVLLTAKWLRGNATQSRQIMFYVYRAG